MGQPAGVTVFCDPTLGAAFRSLDALSRRQLGASVSVLCAPSALMLAQLQRGTRNDILFTLSAALDQAVQAGLVKPETRAQGWSNKIVLAGLRGRVTAPASLAPWLLGRRLALTDPTVAADLDGRAVLARNGLAAAQIMGVANTGDVAFLVTTGAAELGLLYETDAAADIRLAVVAALNAGPAQTDYACAVSTQASSPNAAAFMNLLHGSDAQARFRAAGLEITA